MEALVIVLILSISVIFVDLYLLVPSWYRIDTKFVSNRSQVDSNLVPSQYQRGAKLVTIWYQGYSSTNLAPNWYQGGTEWVPAWYQVGTNLASSCHQNCDPLLVPVWYQLGSIVVAIRYQLQHYLVSFGIQLAPTWYQLRTNCVPPSYQLRNCFQLCTNCGALSHKGTQLHSQT